MCIPVRALSIAAALTTAALVLPTVSSAPNSGFTARAEVKSKDKMTAAEKNVQQVKQLLMKAPDNPPKPDGKDDVKGPTTLQKVKTAPAVHARPVRDCETDPACGGENKAKTGAAVLSKSPAPCSDPECGGENRAKAGAATRQ